MENKKKPENIFDDKTVNVIKKLLVTLRQTVSVAESVTAGFLQAALASAKDASLFFQGGITTYNLGQKSRHLAVEPIHALSCNCVSEKVAGEMAKNACRLFCSDWGIGITGYAAPVPESGNKIFACYAIASCNEVVITDRIIPARDLPLKVQLHYANYSLQQFLRYLDKQAVRKA
jgi:nicotinamide-nucleotide amidase